MPSRVSSIHAPHDLESGEEFERIKQNFRSTVVSPDVTADFPETQAAFEELQFELQEFLVQHISKVSALQARIGSHVVRRRASNGDARLSQGTVTPISMSRRPSGAESTTRSRVVSEGAISEKGGGGNSQRPVAIAAKSPLELHIAALQAFLTSHLENVRVLQSAVPAGPVGVSRSRTVGGKLDRVGKGPRPGEEDGYDTLAQQFHMRVIISTFSAALIMLLLALVNAIIGPHRRMAFSVGMLFSFMALSFHVANIFLAGRGAMLTTGTNRAVNTDIDSLKFYLAICSNLQLASTVLFLVSIAIMIFLIFSSLAFPLVLLFLSLIAGLVVFVSAYWEVPVTLANVQFLVANLGRLRSSLDSLRRSARAERLRPSKAL